MICHLIPEEECEPIILGGRLKIGALVLFIPCANYDRSAGFDGILNKKTIGTVVQIHEKHRWYCVEYLMGGTPDCIGHECFKY